MDVVLVVVCLLVAGAGLAVSVSNTVIVYALPNGQGRYTNPLGVAGDVIAGVAVVAILVMGLLLTLGQRRRLPRVSLPVLSVAAWILPLIVVLGPHRSF